MSVQPNATPYTHRLLQAGFVLFLLGLLTGFVIPVAQLPRMALSSHLEGVMNGSFLIALGLCWKHLVLPAWAERTTFLAAITGTYANWAATLLSAFTGAVSMMPIAGGGSFGSALHEVVVSSLLLILSLAMILTCVLVLSGLQRRSGVQAP
jgi:hydroxylaminobenzene mutase